MKVITITGCLGFIGSYVTGACLAEGWYVRGIDKCTYAANPKSLELFRTYGDKFKFEKKDINDLEFIEDCDYFINLAAESHVGNSIVNNQDFIHSNIKGVWHILELLRNYRQEHSQLPIFLQFSTDEVYGDIASGSHIETDILKPSNPYSSTKAAADQLILGWARTYNLPYIIVRPTNNYGVGQYPEKLIPKVCKHLKLGRKIPLHNEGQPYRNWLHVSDTASAIVTIIKSGVKNDIFNINGNYEAKNIDVVKSILKNYFENTNDTLYMDHVDFSYKREGQDIRYFLDDSKIRKLGWEPKIDFNKTIGPIVNYYKNTIVW